MDPSKLQSDSSNDVNSLESADTVVESNSPNTSSTETSNNATDATGGKNTNQSAKPPIFKRVWQRFNIYLLLFLLVIIIAIAISIVFYLKNRSETVNSKDIINSQDLTTESLKQLANTSINVGNSNQVLNVEPNSIFNGSVLIRKDLEVAGNIKLGGNLQLSGVTITGDGKFGQLESQDSNITGNQNIQGSLTVRKGVSVTGNSTFAGSLTANQIATNKLQLNGDLVLTSHITAGGPIPGISRGGAVGSGGTASLSGSDTSGSVTINTGGSPGAGCFATITFSQRFSSTPHVIITPVGSGAAGVSYYVNRSTSEFSICTTNGAPSGQTFGFDYIVLG